MADTPMSATPEEPTITIRSGEKMPARVVYEDTWMWSCRECGWIGIGCSTKTFAMRESGRHVAESHPHLLDVTVAMGEHND